MGIRNYLGIAVAWTLVLMSCKSKIGEEVRIKASSKIDAYKNFEHWDVLNRADTFFVLGDWKTTIRVYQHDLKVGDFASQDLIKTDFGYKLSGQLPIGFIPRLNGVYILQTNPYQIRKINGNKDNFEPAERLRIANSHYFVDMAPEDDGSLIIASKYGLKRVGFYRYFFGSKILDTLYVSRETIDPQSTLIRLSGENLLIVYPYERVIEVLSAEGKPIRELAFSENPFFDLQFRKIEDGLSPQGFMGLSVQQKLTMLKDEVVDFYFRQDILFTITKVYDRTNFEKLSFDFVLTSFDIHREKHTRYRSPKIPLKFDQKGNIFLLTSGDSPVLEIVPIDEY